MPGEIEKRINSAIWGGFVLALGAVLCNVIFFINPPATRAIPWLSLLLAFVAIFFVAKGLWRAFSSPRIHRSVILGSIVSVFSLLLTFVAFFSFDHARNLPMSAGAPQVGQKAPAFRLEDTMGVPVSFDQLFAPAADGVAPRDMLLIFYRGYW